MEHLHVTKSDDEIKQFNQRVEVLEHDGYLIELARTVWVDAKQFGLNEPKDTGLPFFLEACCWLSHEHGKCIAMHGDGAWIDSCLRNYNAAQLRADSYAGCHYCLFSGDLLERGLKKSHELKDLPIPANKLPEVLQHAKLFKQFRDKFRGCLELVFDKVIQINKQLATAASSKPSAACPRLEEVSIRIVQLRLHGDVREQFEKMKQEMKDPAHRWYIEAVQTFDDPCYRFIMMERILLVSHYAPMGLRGLHTWRHYMDKLDRAIEPILNDKDFCWHCFLDGTLYKKAVKAIFECGNAPGVTLCHVQTMQRDEVTYAEVRAIFEKHVGALRKLVYKPCDLCKCTTAIVTCMRCQNDYCYGSCIQVHCCTLTKQHSRDKEEEEVNKRFIQRLFILDDDGLIEKYWIALNTNIGRDPYRLLVTTNHSQLVDHSCKFLHLMRELSVEVVFPPSAVLDEKAALLKHEMATHLAGLTSDDIAFVARHIYTGEYAAVVDSMRLSYAKRAATQFPAMYSNAAAHREVLTAADSIRKLKEALEALRYVLMAACVVCGRKACSGICTACNEKRCSQGECAKAHEAKCRAPTVESKATPPPVPSAAPQPVPEQKEKKSAPSDFFDHIATGPAVKMGFDVAESLCAMMSDADRRRYRFRVEELNDNFLKKKWHKLMKKLHFPVDLRKQFEMDNLGRTMPRVTDYFIKLVNYIALREVAANCLLDGHPEIVNSWFRSWRFYELINFKPGVCECCFFGGAATELAYHAVETLQRPPCPEHLLVKAAVERRCAAEAMLATVQTLHKIDAFIRKRCSVCQCIAAHYYCKLCGVQLCSKECGRLHTCVTS